MFNPFTRNYRPDLSIKNSIVKKLKRTTNEETVRWLDNAHTGMGKNVQEMRKSLSRGDAEQALVYIADMKLGAIMILSALEIMEDRLTVIPLSGSTEKHKYNTPLLGSEQVSTL